MFVQWEHCGKLRAVSMLHRDMLCEISSTMKKLHVILHAV
uniref:Uncharacterized protein n=2 Tax=Anguilla anguilla TaxID=7936 RepID=A0A0E9TXQ6_ANGAN